MLHYCLQEERGRDLSVATFGKADLTLLVV